MSIKSIAHSLGVSGNKNAFKSKIKLSFTEAHLGANKNSNNFKYLYSLNKNGQKDKNWIDAEDVLKKVGTDRIFIKIE